ncbi:mitochondria-eating protein isoform X4 [Arvicanthis niloticus]|uniref:mitochondria-eating protein isoform X4 n=1 Tax=Arvicanthis niloticus TaxID=61156 RepID=UPI00402BB4D1
MAESVKKLAQSESFQGLQEKVTYWVSDYKSNTCDQNLNYCIELIEQVAKVQAQLFGILTVTAQEGGHNEGVETIKSRLLPLLQTSFSSLNMGKIMDTEIHPIQDFSPKGKNKDNALDQDQQQSDTESIPENQPNQVQDELKSLQAQEDARHKTTKSEHRASRKRTADQRPQEAVSNYEKHLQNLKDEIAVLSAEKSGLQGRSARSRSPSPGTRGRGRGRGRGRSHSHSRSHSRSRSRSHSHSHSHSQSRSNSPCTTVAKIRSPSPNHSKMSSVARKAALLSRFSDAYSQARLDAQCLLRRCIDRAETVQRIIYIATVEAFHVAKMAFRHFKIRVRKMLTPSNVGSNDFETTVSEYIVCHLDLYDSQSSVSDVIRAMNVNPKISFPPEVDFCLLTEFIQEICCIAFAMQSLDPPLDIAFGADGEVFNDCKYRRSYDSDFTAPLVFYHVWPALMEHDCVIMKGEAVTKRGAFWSSVRPVMRCRSRSLSPICPRGRFGISTVSRSRSPSPIRCTFARY